MLRKTAFDLQNTVTLRRLIMFEFVKSVPVIVAVASVTTIAILF